VKGAKKEGIFQNLNFYTQTNHLQTSSSENIRGRNAHDMPPSKTLKDRLINVAVTWPPSSSNYFIPQETLKKLMTRQAILEELEHAFGGDCLAIGQECNKIVNFTVERAVKLFAILLLIGKTKCILNFMTENFSDANFPSQSSEIKSNENILTRNTPQIRRLFGKWNSFIDFSGHCRHLCLN
jgi:hypothetical protein